MFSLQQTAVTFAGGLLAALLATSPVTVSAMEALRPSLSEMSGQVARLLKGRGETSIAVGAFTGPSFAVASSGPGINRIFVEELRKQGVDVERRAALEIKGDYRNVEQKSSGLMVLRVTSRIFDRSGDVLLELEKRIDDRDVLAQALGLNKPDFGSGVSPQKAGEQLALLIDEPAVQLMGTRVTTRRDSPYAIEIAAKSKEVHVPRAAQLVDGLPFVQIDRGEVFAVRLVNNSSHDAAVELTLDGLSIFAFGDNRSYRHVIVPRRSTALIKGWHRTNQLSDEFVITRYADSAAAELLAGPDGVGTITAVFSAAWNPDEQPPADERTKFRDPFGNAVGRGETVQTPFREVRYEHGRTRDIISVRYNKPTAE